MKLISTKIVGAAVVTTIVNFAVRNKSLSVPVNILSGIALDWLLEDENYSFTIGSVYSSVFSFAMLREKKSVNNIVDQSQLTQKVATQPIVNQNQQQSVVQNTVTPKIISEQNAINPEQINRTEVQQVNNNNFSGNPTNVTPANDNTQTKVTNFNNEKNMFLVLGVENIGGSLTNNSSSTILSSQVELDIDNKTVNLRGLSANTSSFIYDGTEENNKINTTEIKKTFVNDKSLIILSIDGIKFEFRFFDKIRKSFPNAQFIDVQLEEINEQRSGIELNQDVFNTEPIGNTNDYDDEENYANYEEDYSEEF